MKKILILNGHPGPHQSFSRSLVQAYANGARTTQAEVKVLHLSDMEFEINLKYGYERRIELEPPLVQFQQDILWADHLVIVFPVWWGGLPAKLKGLFDRAFLPGFAFKPRPGSLWWDKYLKGKSARIISTLDQPGWYYRLVYGRPSVRALRDCTLKFCGYSSIGTTLVGPVKNSSEAFRKKMIDKCQQLGKKLA